MSTLSRIRHRGLLLFFGLLAALAGNARETDLRDPGPSANPPLRFQRLTRADGLSHNRVFDVVQDREGFIWLATQNGLDRFDGLRVRNHRREPGNPQALSDDYILTLALDEDRLWIGTKLGGVHHLDTRSGFIEPLNLGLGPRPPRINCLFESPNGDWWIGTAKGLVRLRATRSGTSVPLDALQAMWVSTMIEVEAGLLWIGTDQGVFEHHVERGETRRPFALASHPTLTSKSVNAFLSDPSGGLWVATSDELFHVGSEGRIREYLRSVQIQDLCRDRSGRLWVATMGQGLALFQPEADRFIHYRNDPFGPKSLVSDLVFSIFEDRDGLLWIGTNDGVSILEPSLQAFAVYQRDPAAAPDIGTYRNVVALERDIHGQMWLGTFSGGLVRLENDRRTARRLRHDADNSQSVSHDFIWDIHTARDGSLWIGTEAGLDRIPPEHLASETPVFQHWRSDAADPESLAEGRVLTLQEDRHDRLWIGTRGGLSVLEPGSEPVSKRIRRYVHDSERGDSLAASPILALYEDRSGILWLGLDGGGLDRFDPETERFMHYVRDPDDPRTLGGEIVTAILEGPEDTLWIASYGGGLEHFHPARGEFVDVLPASFPPSPSISNLLPDNAGDLWFTLGPEVFRFHPETRDLTSFDPSDGLLTNYPPKAALKMPDGELLWGGAEGFVSIIPERIVSYELPPPVVVTDFQVLGREIETREWRSGQVTLGHRDRIFWIEFAALHFADSAQHRFRYRLEGLDDTWLHAAAAQSRVQFSGLAPGTYTFRVQASHKDNAWNEEGATLLIMVRPPLWKTRWAYGLYVLTLTAIAWSYVAALRRKLLRERAISERERAVNRQLREIDRMKDELLAKREEEVRILSGLLPICVSCKKIRDEDDEWQALETYIDRHSEASFSHGICPSCMRRLYPDVKHNGT